MTFLPIAERELRVAARRHGSFWLRVVAAMVALVLGSGFLLIQVLQAEVGGFGRVPFSIGAALFGLLSWLCLGAVLCAGLFFTSDCLSEEKRDGTLGLLFLTDLRGYDVVIGKLLATSLRVFYGLLATFPILAIALLMGGVAGGDFWRKMLALTNTLFFSLAAGMIVSAHSREAHKAMAATFLLVLGMVALPPVADAVWCKHFGQPFTPRLSLLSPGFNFVAADNFSSGPFWWGLLVSHLVAWLFLGTACLAAPRTWQQRRAGRAGGTQSSRRQLWKFGNAAKRAERRRKLLDENPVLWLVWRDRWQGTIIRLLLVGLTGVLFWLVLDSEANSRSGGWPVVAAVGIWLVGFIMNLWMAGQASRFFVEARRSGAMELLLASPLTANEIVRGQWLALRRLFGLPVILLVCLQIVLPLVSSGPGSLSMSGLIGAEMGLPAKLAISLAGALTTVADLVALGWFGMWMGLRSRNANFATLNTYALVQVAPLFVVWFLSGLLGWLFMMTTGMATAVAAARTSSTWFVEIMPLLFALLPSLLYYTKDILFAVLSRKKLYAGFRESAARSVAPIQPPIAAKPLPVPAPPLLKP